MNLEVDHIIGHTLGKSEQRSDYFLYEYPAEDATADMLGTSPIGIQGIYSRFGGTGEMGLSHGSWCWKLGKHAGSHESLEICGCSEPVNKNIM
jgi:hypothetical protein